MGDRNLDVVKGLGKGLTLISGSFRPNGSGTVDNTLNAGSLGTSTGAGFTVARTGVGAFTVTLDDKWNAVAAPMWSYTQVTTADTTLCPLAMDVASAKTLLLTVFTAGTAADIASNAANRIYFTLLVKNTSVGT